MHRLLLSSALSTSLVFHPVMAQAQSWHADRVREEQLNELAAYTRVLWTAHRQVRKYIDWMGWRTRLTEREQQERTRLILEGLKSREVPSENLVPGLSFRTTNSFDVRFRFCEDVLMTYFGTPDFKHNASAEELIDAPVAQALWNGKYYSGALLGQMAEDGEGHYIQERGGKKGRRIPECVIKGEYPTRIRTGTVAIAQWVINPFEATRDRITSEKRTLPCPAGQVGSGILQTRKRRQPVNGRGQPVGAPYYDIVVERDGVWRDRTRHCRAPRTQLRQDTQVCDLVMRTAEQVITVPGEGMLVYDYFWTEVPDPDDPSQVTWQPSDKDGNILPAPLGYVSTEMTFCDGTSKPPTSAITPSTRSWSEEEDRACSNPAWWTDGHQVWGRTATEETYSYSGAFADWEATPDLYTTVILSHTPWAQRANYCRRWHHETRPQAITSDCASGYSGTRSYVRTAITQGTDWEIHPDQITTTYTPWVLTAKNCRRPAPPCPVWRRERGQCDNHAPAGGDRRGGGRERPEGPGSFDVNGDGRGDFQNAHAARAAGYDSGREVSGTCGGCNGPGRGRESGGNKGGEKKIVCTAMNAAYGFGSFRQAIWLAHARDSLTPYHQTGYHLVFLPLVRRAYGSDDWRARGIRKSLEHIARERTADIRAERQQARRRPLGRLYRALLEPACYVVGRLAGGRDVAGVDDVTRIASRRRQTPSPRTRTLNHA
ncbi:hypothetical protein [Ruegeria atlantica]|uniref:hypothetical protein n=1 Tax=Ruegeria atlantica TaxID=81569 RepID=UPI00147C2DE8|nr:hypothetical protein [Ruegeria atlantica]